MEMPVDGTLRESGENRKVTGEQKRKGDGGRRNPRPLRENGYKKRGRLQM